MCWFTDRMALLGGRGLADFAGWHSLCFLVLTTVGCIDGTLPVFCSLFLHWVIVSSAVQKLLHFIRPPSPVAITRLFHELTTWSRSLVIFASSEHGLATALLPSIEPDIPCGGGGGGWG